MMRQKISLVVVIFAYCSFLFSQNTKKCGFNDLLEESFRRSPELRWSTEKTDKRIYASLKSDASRVLSKLITSEQELVIPVVFHILHAGGAENIPDSMIYRSLFFLNQSLNNEAYYDSTSGVKLNIQLCLAQQDPQGNSHSGINRVFNPAWAPLSFYDEYQAKLLTHWDTRRYLNIYVVLGITSYPSGSVFGYSSFPVSHGNPDDGFVVQYDLVGTNEKLNSLLTHEIGHYFGLYHTFEGGCVNNNCLLEGDRICDTPPDNDTWFPDSCSQVINSCFMDTVDPSINNPFRSVALGGIGDQNDLIENYMDYSSLLCYQDFTQGQKDRMRFVLENIRLSLLNTVGCQPPCSGGIQAIYFSSASSEAGVPVQITADYDSSRAHYWLIDDQWVSSAGSIQYAFSDTGYHYITLCISDTCGICRTDSLYITCSAVSSFITTSNSALPGSIIFFDASSSVYDSLLWIIGTDTISANAPGLNYTFQQEGTYLVQLISYYGTCFNTSQQIISIRKCAQVNRALNWFFGNKSGMSFTESGILNITSPMNTAWGTAIVSDELGGLLFYTDGFRFYDRMNEEMPSSPMLYSAGGIQTALILKRPGNNLLYDVPILFNGGGLGFGRVDMSLNGGLGDISDKADSVYLFSNSSFHAVNHCNGKDNWVVSHKNNSAEYWAFLQKENGMQQAVISTSGSVNNSTFPYTNLKLSPDGTKIAITFSGLNFFEISDFNDETGQVSGSLKIVVPGTAGLAMEFSPDSKILYVSLFSGGILQYDVSVMNALVIKNSEYLLPTNYSFGPAALQTGPDHKIYITKAYTTLDVIQYPNFIGAACGYISNAILLSQPSSYGLPAFNASYFKSVDLNTFQIISSADTICLGESVDLYLNSPFCEDSIVWTANGASSFSVFTDSSVRITPNITGQLQVVANRSGVCNEWADTIYLKIHTCLQNGVQWSDNRFDIFPNPASDEIQVVFQGGSESENYSFRIKNSLGQPVYHADRLKNQFTVKLSDFGAKGIYVAELLNSEGKLLGVKKIVYN